MANASCWHLMTSILELIEFVDAIFSMVEVQQYGQMTHDDSLEVDMASQCLNVHP